MSTTTEIWVVTTNKEKYSFLKLHMKLRFFESYKDIYRYLNCLDLARPDLILFEMLVNDVSFFDFNNEENNSELLRLTNFMVVSDDDDVDLARRCYDSGALFYVVEPIKPQSFKAFVEAKVKFVAQEDDAIKTNFKGMLDTTQLEEQIIWTLSRMKEYKAKGDLIRRAIWGDLPRSDKNLEVHVSNLKKKLEKIGYSISREDDDYILHRVNGFNKGQLQLASN